MNLYVWIALAFVAGLSSVVAYYKHSSWLAALILVGQPIGIVALLGWPHDTDFRDTSLVAFVFWFGVTFAGAAVGTAAVVLRIFR